VCSRDPDSRGSHGTRMWQMLPVTASPNETRIARMLPPNVDRGVLHVTRVLADHPRPATKRGSRGSHGVFTRRGFSRIARSFHEARILADLTGRGCRGCCPVTASPNETRIARIAQSFHETRILADRTEFHEARILADLTGVGDGDRFAGSHRTRIARMLHETASSIRDTDLADAPRNTDRGVLHETRILADLAQGLRGHAGARSLRDAEAAELHLSRDADDADRFASSRGARIELSCPTSRGADRGIGPTPHL